MPAVRVTHFDHAAGEVVTPARLDEPRRVLVAKQLFGVPGLHARVEHDGWREGGVVFAQLDLRGREIAGRVEAREGGPQEVDRALRGALGIVGQDKERPVGEGGVVRDGGLQLVGTGRGAVAFELVALAKRRGLDDEAAGREDLDVTDGRARRAVEFGGQVAALLAEAEQVSRDTIITQLGGTKSYALRGS